MEFGDLRGWIDALRASDEIREVTAEVDWNLELGAIVRKVFGNGDGPALLFSKIKDYNHSDARCRRLYNGFYPLDNPITIQGCFDHAS